MRRRVGMQAQIMPTFISMVDQFDASAWSQVGFVEFAKEMRVWRRMMEIIVTLGWVLVLFGMVCRVAYKVPTKNMRATLTFFFHASFSLETCQRGRASIQMSRAMLMAAFAKPRAFTLTHLPFLCSPSHLSQ